MNTQANPLMMTGIGIATAAAIVAAVPTLPMAGLGPVAAAPSISSHFTLLSDSHHWESDDAEGEDGEHEHHHGDWNILGMVSSFLANNQQSVIDFASQVPTFYIGPVAIGQAVLANAFYSGYNGSAPGLPGIAAYVSSQLGTPPGDLVKGLVLGVTGIIPTINLGPVAVGGGRLATAFFDGYNGSGTGFAGIISYVTSQLGLQPAPAAVQGAASRTAAVSAAAALPRAAAKAVTVSVGLPKAAIATQRAAAGAARSAKSAASAAAPRAAAARHAR